MSLLPWLHSGEPKADVECCHHCGVQLVVCSGTERRYKRHPPNKRCTAALDDSYGPNLTLEKNATLVQNVFKQQTEKVRELGEKNRQLEVTLRKERESAKDLRARVEELQTALHQQDKKNKLLSKQYSDVVSATRTLCSGCGKRCCTTCKPCEVCGTLCDPNYKRRCKYCNKKDKDFKQEFYDAKELLLNAAERLENLYESVTTECPWSSVVLNLQSVANSQVCSFFAKVKF